MAHLIVMIGLPGSGKTTLARQLILDSPDRALISTDAIRGKLFGDEGIQGSWLKVWREVGSQFVEAAAQCQLGQMREAIYDATNAARKQRREVLTLAQSSGFTQITGLWVDTPLEVCLQRNQARDRQVPEAIILHMFRQLQDVPPAIAEGFVQILRITPDQPLKLHSLLEVRQTLLQK